MSATTGRVVDRRNVAIGVGKSHRLLALAGLIALSASYLATLHEAAVIVGIEAAFVALALGTIAVAIVVSWILAVRPAALLTAAALVVGQTIYLVTAPGGFANLASVWSVPLDMISLLSGITILAIVGLDVWVLVVTPGPLFLSWYLVLRERYVGGAAIGLGAVTYLSATGDTGSLTAVVGVIGAAGVIGFGQLHRRDARIAEADLLAFLLAVMLIASLSVSVIPGGGAQPVNLVSDGSGSMSTDTALVGGEEMSISGEPSLDPTVRFTIEAEEAENWRVDSFDRYTGSGWVQTGDTTPFEEDPGSPDGEVSTIAVEPEADTSEAFPAPWRPIAVIGVDDPRQSPGDGLRVPGGIEHGDRYLVTADRPNATQAELDTDGPVPAEIADRYTQLPARTPDRVGALTADLLKDAESTHEAAQIIEQYIITTNRYSLDVETPDGDIADVQLFERDEGYCAFFATTMAVMLRTQDIPARVVTGYSSGQRVAEDRWVVRGMNAHAWVEVYNPEVGWVNYDPTPSGPYDQIRDQQLTDAREEGIDGVDTAESEAGVWEPDEAEDPPDHGPNDDNVSGQINDLVELREACGDPGAVRNGTLTPSQALGVCTDEQLAEMEGVSPDDTDNTSPPANLLENRDQFVTDEENFPEDHQDEDESQPTDPDRFLLAVALLIAGVAGVHRGGLTRRARYLLVTRWQGRTDEPTGAVERAWTRLECQLAARYDERRTGETVRGYVDRLSRTHLVDDRIHVVADAYERSRYDPDGVSAAEAREAIDTVDTLVGRRLPPALSLKD